MVYDSAPAGALQTPQAVHGLSLQVVCIETPWRWNCCGAVWPEGLLPLEQCGVFFESLLVQGHGGQVAAGECRRAEGPQRKTRETSGNFEAASWSEGSEGIFDLLLQPGPDLQKACQVLFSDQWRSGSLEVLLLYQEGLFEWLPAFRWLLAEVLPAMSAPLHLRQLKVSNTTRPEKLPVFAAALVVVVAYHKVHHFDFSAYARYARSQGTEMLGLLHLGHEVQWETEGEIEDLGSWGTIRADGARVRQKRDLLHYFEDYQQFDFVLRNHFSPAYSERSMYLPFGPGWGWMMHGKRWLPKASLRGNFCLAALWRPLDFEYHWDRGKLLELLSSEGQESLCNRTGQWVTNYEEQLMESSVSLCPFGSSPETNRLWESLLAGAVVVMTRATFVTANLQAPLILLNSWEELPALLQTLRSSPGLLDQHQQQQSEWFNAYMRSIRQKLKALGQKTVLPSLGTQSGTSEDHAATVLLPQNGGLGAVQLTEQEAEAIAQRRSSPLGETSHKSSLLASLGPI